MYAYVDAYADYLDSRPKVWYFVQQWLVWLVEDIKAVCCTMQFHTFTIKQQEIWLVYSSYMYDGEIALFKAFAQIIINNSWIIFHCNMSHDMTKPTKWVCAQICPVWSESLLSAWRKLVSLATHWAHSEDSDQTGRMPRLIIVFAGRTIILLVLSCRGSYIMVWIHSI